MQPWTAKKPLPDIIPTDPKDQAGYAIALPTGELVLAQTFSKTRLGCLRRLIFHYEKHLERTYADYQKLGYRVVPVSVVCEEPENIQA